MNTMNVTPPKENLSFLKISEVQPTVAINVLNHRKHCVIAVKDLNVSNYKQNLELMDDKQIVS